MSNSLIDYIFCDEVRLQQYIEQIPENTGKEKKRSWKFSLSLTGPAFEAGQETSPRSLTVHEKINKLIKFLREEDLLSEERPQTLNESESNENRPFVLETMTARKVIIPRRYYDNITHLRDLAVWISDPSEKDFSDETWEFRGTFVYLTEAYWDDDEKFGTVWSGCSALQAIVNIANGERLIAAHRGDEPEPFGRLNYDHPIVKLNRIGGTVTNARKITSLYRKRYMTNEQCYIVNDQGRRVNDLLGYPIFIAAAL